jgi:hypothetical protein
MDSESALETLVNFNQTPRRFMPEDSTFHSNCSESSNLIDLEYFETFQFNLHIKWKSQEHGPKRNYSGIQYSNLKPTSPKKCLVVSENKCISIISSFYEKENILR